MHEVWVKIIFWKMTENSVKFKSSLENHENKNKNCNN